MAGGKKAPPLFYRSVLLLTIIAALLVIYSFVLRSPAVAPSGVKLQEAQAASVPRTASFKRGAGPAAGSGKRRPVRQRYKEMVQTFNEGFDSQYVLLDDPEDRKLFKKWIQRTLIRRQKLPGSLSPVSRDDENMIFRYRLTYRGAVQGYLTWQLMNGNWYLIDVEPPRAHE